MNIYKISQNVNNGYDTYDSAVVVAESEEKAQRIYPEDAFGLKDADEEYEHGGGLSLWCRSRHVEVTHIGTADESFTSPCVICASFNAG